MIYIKKNDDRCIKRYDLSKESLPFNELDKIKFISKYAYTGKMRDKFYPYTVDAINSLHNAKIILGEDFYIIYSIISNVLCVDAMATISRDKVGIIKDLELLSGLEVMLAETLNDKGDPSLSICANMIKNTSYLWFLRALFRNKPLIESRDNVVKRIQCQYDYRRYSELKAMGHSQNIFPVNSFYNGYFRVTDYGVERLGLMKKRSLIRE